MEWSGCSKKLQPLHIDRERLYVFLRGALLFTFVCMTTYIYSIVLDGRVVYVGRTRNPAKRYRAHMANAFAFKGNKRTKTECLYSAWHILMKKGKVAEMRILSICPKDKASEKESFWIKEMKKEYSLFNNHLSGTIFEMNQIKSLRNRITLKPMDLVKSVVMRIKTEDYVKKELVQIE